jgi:hypothetical protein
VIQILENNKKDIIKEMCKISEKLTKQFDMLTESHNDLRKQLEAHINGSSGDDSSAPRCCLLPSLCLSRAVQEVN